MSYKQSEQYQSLSLVKPKEPNPIRNETRNTNKLQIEKNEEWGKISKYKLINWSLKEKNQQYIKIKSSKKLSSEGNKYFLPQIFLLL